MKQKLLIDFDARMLHNSGIGTQVDNVLHHLVQSKMVDLRLLGREEELKRRFPEMEDQIFHFDRPIYSLSEQFSFPGLRPGAFLHSPHYNTPLKHLKRSVVVVHDLIHLQSSEFAKPHYRLYAKLMLDRIARHAARIVTVSETTRQELVMRFPSSRDRSITVHNGIDHDLFYPRSATEIKKFRERYQLPEKFMLVVGIGKKHKNVDFVIRSLSTLWRNGDIKMPLVMGGTGGKIPDYVRQEIAHNQVENWIKPLPFLDRAELPLMYGSATFLIMPSLLEGFGFPVLESMATGTPVLCSNASSLPEIGGKAALFFNPTDPVDLSSRLTELATNKKMQKDLTESGLRHSRTFSWKKHTRELLSVYESLA